MSRDLHASTAAALPSGPYRPVLIGRFNIVDDPVYAWTGTGLYMPTGTSDTALNGNTYDPAEGFIELTPIKEDLGMGGPVVLTMAGHDLDEDLLRQVVRDKRAWRLKPAYLWAALLDSSFNAVVGEPFRMKTGVMTRMEVSRNADEAVVRVTIDGDRGRAKSGPYLIRDHPRVWPGDTYANYLGKLANKPGGLEGSDVRQGNVGSVLGSQLGQQSTSYPNFPFYRY